jgi:hypothetical protein
MHKALTIRKSVAQGALVVLMAPAPAMATADPAGVRITLPSGSVVFWQETLYDNAGGQGLTARFRFVMPDLAQRVPSTSGPASDFAEEEPRGPVDIDTETGEVIGDEMEAETYAPDPVPDQDMPTGDDMIADMTEGGAEEAADAQLEEPVLPAAPDVLAQDPVHQDVVWLCENWALPRIASPAPRPAQIVISLADKAIPFAAYDPDVVQLFEAFRLPPDRDACEWEPW